MVEVGYYLHAITCSPTSSTPSRTSTRSTRPDEKRTQGGLAFYFNGHNSNLKLALTKIDKRRRQEAQPVSSCSTRSSLSRLCLDTTPKGGIP